MTPLPELNEIDNTPGTETPDLPNRRFKAFFSLSIPAYRLYFGALLGQMAAMNMQVVARSWFMYELTGRASMLGTVALAGAVPMLTLSLFGGVLADRVKKKNVLVIGQLFSAFVALGIALSISFGAITWIHLIIASLLQGTIMSLMMPSRQALIHELVGEHSLMNAISLNAAAMNLLRLLAPAFAGFFIALWSIEGVYYMMCGLYFMGFFFASRLPVKETIQPLLKKSPLSELRDGLSYIRRDKIIFTLLILTLFSTILSMPYFFLLPVFAKDIFIINAEDMGWFTSLPLIGGLIATLVESSARQGLLISTSGIGALVGSLILASMSNRRRGLLLLLSLTLAGLSLVIFSLTGSFLIALLIFLPLGFGQAGRMALSNTLLQSYTDDAYRGRVMSVYMMEWGITFIGVFIVGVAADYIGVRWAVGGSAGLLMLTSLYYISFKPKIRRLD